MIDIIRIYRSEFLNKTINLNENNIETLIANLATKNLNENENNSPENDNTNN